MILSALLCPLGSRLDRSMETSSYTMSCSPSNPTMLSLMRLWWIWRMLGPAIASRQTSSPSGLLCFQALPMRMLQLSLSTTVIPGYGSTQSTMSDFWLVLKAASGYSSLTLQPGWLSTLSLTSRNFQQPHWHWRKISKCSIMHWSWPTKTPKSQSR